MTEFFITAGSTMLGVIVAIIFINSGGMIIIYYTIRFLVIAISFPFQVVTKMCQIITKFFKS